MSKNLLDQRWPWMLAFSTILVVYVMSTFVDVRFGPDGDPRPVGSIDDIASLPEREDLNVLFIVIDTLRSDRLGSYGYERDTSPNLDRLAASGARFHRHLSQSSWTKCSMASMWTGLYPNRTGITRFDHVIPDEARMPAEIFKEAGFQTVAVYRNGWISPNFGFNQGFDVYSKAAPRRAPPSVRRENPTVSERGTDQDTVAGGVEFLRIRGDERWFLYLHLMDVHEYVYDEQTALFGSTYSDIYDNSIRWVDDIVGVLLDELAARGYLENTLIAITADHGEAFLERGLEGHARWVYRETTEVPLILSFPFKLEPGVVVETRTRNIDIWPTLLELIGLEAAPGIDGQSRVPELLASARGEEQPEAEASTGIAHLDRTWGQRGKDPNPTIAVTRGGYRYVRTDRPGALAEQLFDASLDPAELDDRSEQDAEALAALREVADAYLEMKPPWEAAPARELTEMELNQLRALGYALP